MGYRNRVGEVYGRLTIVEHSHTKCWVTSKQTLQYWKCVCVCGETVTVGYTSLATGGTKSCGCLRREIAALNRPTPKRNKGLSGTHEYALWAAAKERSVKFKRPFDIEVSDIVIPETCPVLGIPLFKGVGKQTRNSPTLDRIDTTKGYVKGNVAVISLRANSLKQDATVEMLEKLIAYMKQ